MNGQHNENGPTSRGNDNAGPGQPPRQKEVVVTDDTMTQATDSEQLTAEQALERITGFIYYPWRDYDNKFRSGAAEALANDIRQTIERVKADERLAAVAALHRKQTRYMLEGYEERSWDSEEDARAWDDMGWQTGKPLETFDVCTECSHVEWDSVSQQTDGEGSMGITSMWPCRTAQALGEVV